MEQTMGQAEGKDADTGGAGKPETDEKQLKIKTEMTQ